MLNAPDSGTRFQVEVDGVFYVAELEQISRESPPDKLV